MGCGATPVRESGGPTGEAPGALIAARGRAARAARSRFGSSAVLGASSGDGAAASAGDVAGDDCDDCEDSTSAGGAAVVAGSDGGDASTALARVVRVVRAARTTPPPITPSAVIAISALASARDPARKRVGGEIGCHGAGVTLITARSDGAGSTRSARAGARTLLAATFG